MKFCENMKLTCLKIIIIIIIGYTLNNFTPHIKTSWVDDGKIVISKIKNKFIFLKSNLKQGSLLQRSNNCQMLSTPWKFISVSLIQKREPYARDAKYPLKWALSSTGFACLFAHLFFWPCTVLQETMQPSFQCSSVLQKNLKDVLLFFSSNVSHNRLHCS